MALQWKVQVVQPAAFCGQNSQAMFPFAMMMPRPHWVARALHARTHWSRGGVSPEARWEARRSVRPTSLCTAERGVARGVMRMAALEAGLGGGRGAGTLKRAAGLLLV